MTQSDFVSGSTPAFNTVDAQVSYKLPAIKTLIKLAEAILLIIIILLQLATRTLAPYIMQALPTMCFKNLRARLLKHYRRRTA